MAKRIAIISDLHLTSDRRYSEFTHDPEAFSRFLDRLEASHDLIYLVGDIYNLHHARWPGARGQHTELLAARRRFPTITQRFRHPPYRRVYGNHDVLLARTEGVPLMRLEQHESQRILVTHGHQFDGMIKQWPVIAPTGAWLEAWVRRLGLSAVGEALVAIGRRVNTLDPRRPPGGAGALLEENWHLHCGRALMKEHGADAIVMGHTHAPLIHRFEDGTVYINAGSCSFGVWTWASLVPETLGAELHQHPG